LAIRISIIEDLGAETARIIRMTIAEIPASGNQHYDLGKIPTHDRIGRMDQKGMRESSGIAGIFQTVYQIAETF
jgi:hypothetical protein